MAKLLPKALITLPSMAAKAGANFADFFSKEFSCATPYRIIVKTRRSANRLLNDAGHHILYSLFILLNIFIQHFIYHCLIFYIIFLCMFFEKINTPTV